MVIAKRRGKNPVDVVMIAIACRVKPTAPAVPAYWNNLPTTSIRIHFVLLGFWVKVHCADYADGASFSSGPAEPSYGNY